MEESSAHQINFNQNKSNNRKKQRKEKYTSISMQEKCTDTCLTTLGKSLLKCEIEMIKFAVESTGVQEEKTTL